MAVNADSLRRWMHGLRFTPLHPQFFAYRYERYRYKAVGGLCSGRVLDIGCGRQPLRQFLRSECDYVGLDHPQTGSLYESRPSIHADARSLPFPDQAFDTVVCLEVLEHLSEPHEALCEARRVLKSDGRMILSTPFLYPIHDAPTDYYRWTRHGLEMLATSAGLRFESLRGLGSPMESGALQLNLALAWQVMNASPAWRIPFFALTLLLVPIVNLLGMLRLRPARLEENSPFAVGYLGTLVIRSGFKAAPRRREAS